MSTAVWLARATMVVTVLTPVLAVPPAAGSGAAPRLFAYGDSFADGTEPYLPDALPDWEVEQDALPNRGAADAAPALRAFGTELAPVIHLSLGTVDDPTRPNAFRGAVRRAMAAAGGSRCVVWPNIWRPFSGRVDWRRLNKVLADEAQARHNLVMVDWRAMIMEHRDWLSPVDGTHVDARGYRARARAIARGARACLKRSAPPLSRLERIKIWMFWERGLHRAPHFHATYKRAAAAFDLRGRLVAGSLPKAARALVATWARQREAELALAWQQARRGEPRQPIKPLV